MPKTSNYGASYPDGAIIAHDGTVTNGPDEGNDAPRIEDESRPGGAVNATPIDQDNPRDERSLAGQQAKAEDGQEQGGKDAKNDERNSQDEQDKSNVKPLKQARSARTNSR